MAEKRYSPSDMAKMTRDKLADYRAKGIDARQIAPTHPGGLRETLKTIDQELGATRDQSQEQIGRAQQRHDKAVKEGREKCREMARKYPNGPESRG